MLPLVLLLLFLGNPVGSQFAEIASIATSLLGPSLGAAGLAGTAGSAAGSAAGALGQIGQLYQLAQGALQLTGTGVGVLNQASEGNWFPALLESTAKNTENLRTSMGQRGAHGQGGLMGLGGLPTLPPLGGLAPGGRGGLMGLGGGNNNAGSNIGPEFGTSFPAPDIDDYTDPQPDTKTAPKPPAGLTDIDDKDADLAVPPTPRIQPPVPQTLPPTVAPITTTGAPVTLFPDEEDLESNSIDSTTEEPKKQIRIELPKRTSIAGNEDDYIDQITREGNSEVKVTQKEKIEEDENLLGNESKASGTRTLETKRAVPDLTKLIDALRKSNLSEDEIMEIVAQVEGNSNVEKPPKIDWGAGVQNIAEKKAANRARILQASRVIDTNLNTDARKEAKTLVEHTSRQTNELRSVLVTLPPPSINSPKPFIRQPNITIAPNHLPVTLTTTQQTSLLDGTAQRQVEPILLHLLDNEVNSVEANRLQREISPAPVDKGSAGASTSGKGAPVYAPVTQQRPTVPQQQVGAGPQQGYQQQGQNPQVTNNWHNYQPQNVQGAVQQPQLYNQPLQQFQAQQQYQTQYYQNQNRQQWPQQQQYYQNYQQNQGYGQHQQAGYGNQNYGSQYQGYGNQQQAPPRQGPVIGAAASTQHAPVFQQNNNQNQQFFQQKSPGPVYSNQQLQYQQQATVYQQRQNYQGPQHQGGIVQQQYNTQQVQQQQQRVGNFGEVNGQSAVVRGVQQQQFLNFPTPLQQQGVTNIHQKARQAGYTAHVQKDAANPQNLLRHLRESSVRTTQAPPIPAAGSHPRKFPRRTVQTQHITTPAPVGQPLYNQGTVTQARGTVTQQIPTLATSQLSQRQDLTRVPRLANQPPYYYNPNNQPPVYAVGATVRQQRDTVTQQVSLGAQSRPARIVSN